MTQSLYVHHQQVMYSFYYLVRSDEESDDVLQREPSHEYRLRHPEEVTLVFVHIRFVLDKRSVKGPVS